MPLGHGHAGGLAVVASNLGDVDAVAVAAEEVVVGRQLLGFVEVLDEDDPCQRIELSVFSQMFIDGQIDS